MYFVRILYELIFYNPDTESKKNLQKALSQSAVAITIIDNLQNEADDEKLIKESIRFLSAMIERNKKANEYLFSEMYEKKLIQPFL